MWLYAASYESFIQLYADTVIYIEYEKIFNSPNTFYRFTYLLGMTVLPWIPWLAEDFFLFSPNLLAKLEKCKSEKVEPKRISPYPREVQTFAKTICDAHSLAFIHITPRNSNKTGLAMSTKPGQRISPVGSKIFSDICHLENSWWRTFFRCSADCIYIRAYIGARGKNSCKYAGLCRVAGGRKGAFCCSSRNFWDQQ